MKQLTYLLSIASFLIYSQTQCHGQNYALSFDGINDYVDIPLYTNMSPTDAVTIEAWIKGGAITSTQFIYDRIETNDGYGINITAAGNARVTINGGTVSVSSTINVLNGSWNHIAATYDRNAGMVNLYVNGILDGSTAYSSQITYSPEPRNGIGGPGASSSTFFNGEIGEVRVWNYARTVEELQTNMCTVLNPTMEPGLIAYWQLNEGSGTSTADLTSNGNNGTLLNGPTWVPANYCSTTGLDEQKRESNFKIFPNPMSGFTTLEIIQPQNQSYQLKMVNLSGQLIREANLTGSNTYVIDRQNLEAGFYFIQVMTNDKIIGVKKLIVE